MLVLVRVKLPVTPVDALIIDCVRGAEQVVKAVKTGTHSVW